MSNKFTVVMKHKRRANRGPIDIPDEDYDRVYNDELKQCKELKRVIDTFISTICRNFSDKAIEAIRENSKDFYIYEYNDDTERGELYNNKIENYDTKYILQHQWMPLLERYCGPQTTIESRILKYIKVSRFNNGVDPITKKDYKVSNFNYKRNESKFKNGILISRNGIQYT